MTEPLRVLQIANQAGPLRLFMLPVCQAMRDAGAELELACMRGGPNYVSLEKAGFPLHGLSPGSWLHPLTWLRAYRQVRSLLRRRRYDLVVAHTPAMSWIARLAATGCTGAVVYMAHGLPFAPRQNRLKYILLRGIEQRVARHTDAVIVMNRDDAEACERFRLVRPGGRWFHVPGVGLDVDLWGKPPDQDRRRELDRELGLSEQRPLILYLGRFIADKRPGDVLELARRTGPTADFILAGEGPLWKRIRRQAAQVGRNVRVLGWTECIGPLMHRCTLAVFPSVYREGLPRFLLEAQAAGKPVVAYDVRGSRDAIDSGRTGLLVPPADVDAFCQASQRLLADEDLRRRLGQAGRRWVRGRFSLTASVKAQLSALAVVLAEKGIHAPWS